MLLPYLVHNEDIEMPDWIRHQRGYEFGSERELDEISFEQTEIAFIIRFPCHC